MGEVDLAAPVLNLGEAGELRAVVHGNGLKDLRELVSKLFLEQLQGTQNGVRVPAGNLEGDVVFRFLLQQGEDNGLLASLPVHHSVAFPMAFLDAQSRDLRPLIDVLAVVFLVFARLGILVPLAFQGLRQLCHRQVEITGPDLVIQGMRAYHLVHREQPVQAGITDAGVQRPLVLFELLCHPTKDALAAANPMVSARMLPVGLVDGLAVLCRVAGFPALIALTRRCAAPQLVCYGGR